jgi:hypothetical protein
MSTDCCSLIPLRFEQLAEYAQTREGIHKPTSLLLHGFDWFRHFAGDEALRGTPRNIYSGLKNFATALSIPECIENLFLLGRSVQEIRVASTIDEQMTATRKAAKDGLSALIAGSDSALFLEEQNVVSLGEAAKGVQVAFWGSSFLLSSIDYYDHNEERVQAEAQAAQTQDPHLVAHYQRSQILSILRQVRDIAMVGMAALALVGLIFQTIVFPALFLALSTTYVVLSIVIPLGQKMIDNLSPHRFRIV